MPALIGTLTALAPAAKEADIGMTVDAEEADRLEISLDVFAAVLADGRFAGWDGLGFAVQAYQKRALPLIDWIAALGRRTQHCIPTRLVKGAYWDSEIKLAQVQGHPDYPVFTRKAATDVSWLACTRRMLECRDAIHPAFATHNAHSLAFVLECVDACPGKSAGDRDFEMQRLHGMGEALYHDAHGPVRVYAPVGTHEDLLAYLVRRLLENGANTSFVHRLVDPSVPEEAIVADPVVGCVPSASAAIRASRCRMICIPTGAIPPASILPTGRRPPPCSPRSSVMPSTLATSLAREKSATRPIAACWSVQWPMRRLPKSMRNWMCLRVAGATGTWRVVCIAPKYWSAPPI